MTALPANDSLTEAKTAPAPKTAKQTGAHAVVRTLEALGVERVFGYPGGAIMPVYDALTGSSLQHMNSSNEKQKKSKVEKK